MKADWQTKNGEPPGKPDFLNVAMLCLFALAVIVAMVLLWWSK